MQDHKFTDKRYILYPSMWTLIKRAAREWRFRRAERKERKRGLLCVVRRDDGMDYIGR